MRRHPNARSLAAWFDGENAAGVGEHVAGCERCRGRVHELRRVRAAVRGEPVAAPLPVAPGRWRPLAVPVAVVVLVLALLAATVPATVTGPMRAARDLFDRRGERGEAAGPAASPTTAPGQSATAAPRITTPSTRPAPVATPTTRGPAAAAPVLRLAVVVTMSGPLAAEAAGTVTAARQAVDAANRAGGVGGRRVELVVVDAADTRAVAGLAGTASVAVGGFGATPPVPWVLPADPYARGSITAEASPTDAGTFLGRDLVRRGFRGTVAAVVGDGPDAGLADGIAAAMPVARVAMPADSTCDSEIRAARRALPVALALAIAPDLARRCLEAAARLGWRPPGGILVAPSVAYAGLERVATAGGSRTVLGLPWPTGDEPGAARFRAAVPQVRSYRALVAFAAAELAVASARADFPFRLQALTTGTWRTDLVTLAEGANVAARIVVAGPGGWATAGLASGERE